MEYSERILKYIDDRGITAYALSKATNITDSTFSAWRKKPTSKMYLDIVVKIADHFNISVDELIGRSDKP